MADKGLMLNEDFEERLKRGAPGSGDQDVPESRRNFGDVAKVCSSLVESAAARVKVHVALLAKADMEPKTGLGLAAFNGFFSA